MITKFVFVVADLVLLVSQLKSIHSNCFAESTHHVREVVLYWLIDLGGSLDSSSPSLDSRHLQVIESCLLNLWKIASIFC